MILSHEGGGLEVHCCAGYRWQSQSWLAVVVHSKVFYPETKKLFLSPTEETNIERFRGAEGCAPLGVDELGVARRCSIQNCNINPLDMYLQHPAKPWWC